MMAQELEAAEADVQLKKKPRHNNLVKAEEFVKQVKIALDEFADVIHSYESYKVGDVILTLLSNIMTS